MSQYPCQTCGQPLVWVPQYNQWYCNTCKSYIQPQQQYPGQQKGFLDNLMDDVSKELDGLGGSNYRCQTCGNQIRFVEMYHRWYCDFCKRYV